MVSCAIITSSPNSVLERSHGAAIEAVLEQVGKGQTDRLRHALSEAEKALSASHDVPETE